MTTVLAAIVGFLFGYFIRDALQAPYFNDDDQEDFNYAPFDPSPAREDSFFVLTTGDHHDQK